MEPVTDLKAKIREFCLDAGADLIGFASVERWDEANEVPPEFRPKSLWKQACTVIVLGFPCRSGLWRQLLPICIKKLMRRQTVRLMAWPLIWSGI